MPLEGLTPPTLEGQDAPNLSVPKEEVPSSLDQSHPLPQEKLEQPAAHTSHPFRERALGSESVWPLLVLPGGDFLPLIYCQALVSAARPGLCSLLQKPACTQSPPGFSPCSLQASPCSNTPGSVHRALQASPCSLLASPCSLQASPCSMPTLIRAPHLSPHEQMLHPGDHSWAVLCQMCKSTPLPLLSLRGCGLAALGWGREEGCGEVKEGEGRLRFLPL